MNQLLLETRHKRLTACVGIAVFTLVTLASAHSQQSSSTETAKKPTTQADSKQSASKQSSAHKTTTHTASSGKHSSRKKKSGRTRGQQKIDSERAQAIQAALIREHYLSGEPSGSWNQASEDAMRKYQSDHGWQTKEVPDSRALISLGLGPSNDHLLNPESAMTTGPAAAHAALPSRPASRNADAGAGVSKNSTPAADSRPAATSNPATSNQDPQHPQ